MYGVDHNHDAAQDVMQNDAAVRVPENDTTVVAEQDNIEMAHDDGQGPTRQQSALQNEAEAPRTSSASTPSLVTRTTTPTCSPNEQHGAPLESTTAESVPGWARAFMAEQRALMEAFRTEMMETIDSAMNGSERHG